MGIKDSFKKKLENSQPKNFARLFPMLEASNSYVELRNVLGEFNKVQDEIGKDNYVFRNEDRIKFFDTYNELKKEFYPDYEQEQKQAIAEVHEILAELESIDDIKILKQQIYEAEVLDKKEITQPLYEACDVKIEQLKAA